MNLTIDVEPYLGTTTYPLVTYALYADTTAASILNNYFTGSTITFNLTSLAVGKYYLRIGTYFGNEFASYRLTAAYTEKCANAVAVSASSQGADCLGSITYLVSGGLAPYTVQLYKDGTAYSNPLTIESNITFYHLEFGTYYLRSFSFGASGLCNNVSANTVFAIPATPTISAGGPASFCAGDSVTLTSSGAASYLWSNGATTQSITVSTAGSYTVTIKNAAGCTSATSAATIVTVNPLPTVSLSPFNAVCNTIPAFTLTGGSPAGGTYSGQGVTNGQFNPAAAGLGTQTITYSYTNVNGCIGTAQSAIVVNNCGGCSAAITAGGAITFCEGGSVVLTASAGVSYLWSNGATTQSITISNSGNYTVTVTDANNCSATSAATVVTVNTLPATPAITADGPTTFCAGGSVTLTSSAAASYLWSNGATSQSITTGSEGIFSVTVKNTAGCSSAISAALTVSVNPLPTVTLGTFSAVCNTLPAFTLTGGSPAGGIYSGTGVSNGQFNPATAGVGTQTITYTYTNSNGCRASAQQPIVVNNCAACTATITAGGPTIFCQGGSVLLTASAGASYLWSNGATTQSINVNTGGSYTVTVTNANNCSAISVATVVTVNALPSTPAITAGGPTTFCAPGSVVLTSSAAASYLWSNGATTQSITVRTSGSYSVTVKNTAGCAARSAAVVVTVNNCGNTYCTAGGTSCIKGYINKVEACYGFSNTTGFTGYGDYTSKTVTSAPGKILGIDVTPGYPAGKIHVPMYIKTWIDWNADGDFTDVGETVFAPSIPITVKTKFWVKVPLGTTPGNKRMRVALRSDVSPGGCGSFTYGEVEDYTVVIAAARFAAPDITVNEFDVAGNSFQIYPNPVSDRMIIERSGYDEAKANASPAQMFMTDANGRMVLQARLSSLVQAIDVSKMANGIYFVTIITTADKKTSRVIINH
ncbi:MAG: T9SS type A sorting domain-containing protein [Chitinophagaceae bacterium]|nr:T9SS type A sorting domain-containing protein [Chitinophagaceae bacterium]